MAVLEFDYGAVKPHWNGAQVSRFKKTTPLLIDAMEVGKGIADLFVDELINDDEIRLIERTRLADVAKEQEGGDKTRARYLVMGTVTKFGGEEKTRAGAAIAMGLVSMVTHAPFLGLFATKDTFAYVGLSCRVMDATTGEIVGSVSGQGQSQRKDVLLGGLVGGHGGGGVKVGSADFQLTILGEATVGAVKDAAGKIKMMLTRAAARVDQVSALRTN